MSARVGRNMLLVQGAGGNSSIKDGDVLWVKASGTWLADADAKDIFVPVSLGAARLDRNLAPRSHAAFGRAARPFGQHDRPGKAIQTNSAPAPLASASSAAGCPWSN
jgi:hypothetical protein